MRSDHQLPRLSWLIAALLLSSCSSGLRARYSFIADDGYRVDPGAPDPTDIEEQEPLLVRCTENESPVTCAFEDQDVVVDLELVNRAPLLTIANESEETIVVSWIHARFVLPDGKEVPAELVNPEHRPPTATELEPNEMIEVRVHPLHLWEERCSDVSEYTGPTRSGRDHVLSLSAPKAAMQSGAPVAGCRFFPMGMVRDSAQLNPKEPLSRKAQRAFLRTQIGKKIRLVLPVQVAGKAFEYVVAYAVAGAEIR